jgi:hypothetical protein
VSVQDRNVGDVENVEFDQCVSDLATVDTDASSATVCFVLANSSRRSSTLHRANCLFERETSFTMRVTCSRWRVGAQAIETVDFLVTADRENPGAESATGWTMRAGARRSGKQRAKLSARRSRRSARDKSGTLSFTPHKSFASLRSMKFHDYRFALDACAEAAKAS